MPSEPLFVIRAEGGFKDALQAQARVHAAASLQFRNERGIASERIFAERRERFRFHSLGEGREHTGTGPRSRPAGSARFDQPDVFAALRQFVSNSETDQSRAENDNHHAEDSTHRRRLPPNGRLAFGQAGAGTTCEIESASIYRSRRC